MNNACDIKSNLIIDYQYICKGDKNSNKADKQSAIGVEKTEGGKAAMYIISSRLE